MNQIKGKQRKVHPRVKRMTVMIHLYTKIFFQRGMKEFFDKLKIIASSKNQTKELIEDIITCA
jgi:hypothetical protein